ASYREPIGQEHAAQLGDDRALDDRAKVSPHAGHELRSKPFGVDVEPPRIGPASVGHDHFAVISQIEHPGKRECKQRMENGHLATCFANGIEEAARSLKRADTIDQHSDLHASLGPTDDVIADGSRYRILGED